MLTLFVVVRGERYHAYEAGWNDGTWMLRFTLPMRLGGDAYSLYADGSTLDEAMRNAACELENRLIACER